MATTIDDLINLKDEACEFAYAAVEGILAVFGDSTEGAMGELLAQGRAVTERHRLYDAADADDDVVSIDDYEETHPEEAA